VGGKEVEGLSVCLDSAVQRCFRGLWMSLEERSRKKKDRERKRVSE
jgi:hypothetical protein